MSEPAGWLPEAGGEPRIPAERRRGPSITSASTAPQQQQQQQQQTAGEKPGVGVAPHRPAGKGIIYRGTPPPNHRAGSPSLLTLILDNQGRRGSLDNGVWRAETSPIVTVQEGDRKSR